MIIPSDASAKLVTGQTDRSHMNPDVITRTTRLRLMREHPAKCRPRFSDRQKNALIDKGFPHLRLAQKIVRELHKINGSNSVASNFQTIEVENGRIYFNNQWHFVASTGSTNYTVCGAILKGILTPETSLALLSESKFDKGEKPPLKPYVHKVYYDEVKDAAKDKAKEALINDGVFEPKLSLLEKIWKLRDYCESGQHSDSISTGAIAKAKTMLDSGIPERAILHALTINWPETARNANSIRDYDPSEYGEPIEGLHKYAAYAVQLAKLRIPSLYVGPTQSGKSTLAEHVAKHLDLPFGKVPLTGGASPGWLLGRDTRDGFKDSRFVQIFRDGGVFLFDEVDAADPNMLVVLNDALANGGFDHPYIGYIPKHEDFIPIAAANTWGTGATAEYGGRSRLDGATLERFRLGRIFLDYDKDIERKIWGSDE